MFLRSINNLRISVKLLLTSLLYTVLFLVLAATAYYGLESQDRTAEAIRAPYLVFERSAELSLAVAQVQIGIDGALREDSAFSDTERTGAVRFQRSVLETAAGRIREVLAAEGLDTVQRDQIRVVLRGLERLTGVLDHAGTIRTNDLPALRAARTDARDSASAVLRDIRTLQEAASAAGQQNFSRFGETHSSAVTLLAILLAVSIGMAILINVIIRKAIMTPVRAIERAASQVAQGNLLFNMEATGTDELGRAGIHLRDAFEALERVLHRIKELTMRIHDVVMQIEQTAANVVAGSGTEAEAMSSISAAIEEMNATVEEISSNTDGLASSSADAALSVQRLVESIRSIDESIHQLDQLVAATNSSIGQLTEAVQDVETGSGELDESSQSAASAIARITASVREVRSTATESASLADQVTQEAATLGLRSIERTIEGMREISSAVSATAAGIEVLGKRSKEIEMIVHVIESVNHETSLLSLNAAILASQAGEHGKGFAVIAGMIKELSDRTDSSTKDITALIQTVQKEIATAQEMMQQGIRTVEDGAGLAQEGANALNRILDSSRKASEMARSIEGITEEQSRAAALVDESSRRMQGIIERVTNASARQSDELVRLIGTAASMNELSRQVAGATGEQAKSSGQIEASIKVFADRSRQISRSLSEHREGARSILENIDAVKLIPTENRDLATKISKTLWNMQRDVELLGAEMERFVFHDAGRSALRFGVVPLKEPAEMYRKFKPLSEYLSGRLGRKFDLKVAMDMENAVRDVGENNSQLCAMGPANYTQAYLRYGVTVIAKALRKGKPFHHSVIVARTSASVATVGDLAGKRFAFGSIGSATGHIMPLAMLKGAGVTIGGLGFYDFLGHHENQLQAVQEGRFDAAGMIEDAVLKFGSQDLQVIARSSEIPEFSICCNPSVDGETRQRIVDALISLDPARPEDAEILQSLGKDCTGFLPASDLEFAAFRDQIASVAEVVAAAEYRRTGEKKNN